MANPKEPVAELTPDDGIVTVEATRDYSERGLMIKAGQRVNVPLARVKRIMKEHNYQVPEFDEKRDNSVKLGKDGKLILQDAPLPIKIVEASKSEIKELRFYSNRAMTSREKKYVQEREMERAAKRGEGGDASL